jgi:hypothetical protein
MHAASILSSRRPLDMISLCLYRLPPSFVFCNGLPVTRRDGSSQLSFPIASIRKRLLLILLMPGVKRRVRFVESSSSRKPPSWVQPGKQGASKRVGRDRERQLDEEKANTPSFYITANAHILLPRYKQQLKGYDIRVKLASAPGDDWIEGFFSVGK